VPDLDAAILWPAAVARHAKNRDTAVEFLEFKAETVPIGKVGAHTAAVQQMLDGVGFK